ncbi:MAG TPA: bifunctional UDP-N-acetylglucosamine diphosphorylase/glucosamine-1-phosphate N-acetyltransferase GlmU [Egibacteraceae bacterium]|nr:bifunctional UDP-N-acetylglucosamine diphosphorylase/glucosamine-1-phosphate N-acetyltransferase GlmU [Egibacteraceae bacterium]
MSAEVAAVVLAAGQGTRFRSDRAKVLHEVAGRSMLRWVLESLRPLGLDRVVVVVGHQADAVRAEAEGCGVQGLTTVVQAEQRGTGHAVRQAMEVGALDDADTVLVVPGDVPLLTPAPLRRLLDAHGARAATLLTTRLPDPTGYGRVLRDHAGEVVRIVEERDATDAERQVDEVGTSIYAFAREPLAAELARLSTGNAQGEEYLTDIIGPLSADAVLAPAELVAGVNDRAQLADAGAVLRRRILDRLMREGVTVIDPASTYVDADAVVEADAVLRPGTLLEGRCVVGAHADIGPDARLVDAIVETGATVTYSVMVEASVGPQATVGPYTYLRPGTRLERGAKAGAFVEIKQSVIGEGSKVPHLSYIGDATVGKDANIGAATVTVNYDGQHKHKTVIGDGAFIGSDTMLVAPVEVGPRAYTGAGSVITHDVPGGALAVERNEQRIVPDYADRKRKPR